ncbi:mechanosensitive ion channel family protein [uncultured Shewanella sp.]|uniref:mechanosensitive ion channel family protein n=1 Tax=uncultured Shewanella sp. TaxID=173975 RepID=UPI00261EFD94|nr:mechanosensitive ion channel family protein [uncultured Shewanella sp.]
MNYDFRSQISHWVSSWGLNEFASQNLVTGISIVGCLLFALVVYLIVRRVIVRTVNLVIKHSKVSWDDTFMRHQVLEKMALLAPLFVLSLLVPLALSETPLLSTLTERLLDFTIVILVIRVIFSALDAANEVADLNLVSRRLPIKSFVQLLKLFLFFVAIIICVSILSDQSPVYFLSGLGVATGLVMLVFKDTILGFVAGIQLAANRMVSPGDWIQMDKYGADGSVEEVSLTTVKVRNWDKTITMIPAYALVSDAFKNWRGMSESGGRRIKRALIIDTQTIQFINDEDKQRLSKINHLKEYLTSKKVEMDAYNSQVTDADMRVNSRHLTNIGTFRAYMVHFLRNHPNVHQDMTLLVRQLAPVSEGIPIEIYVFTNDTRWDVYEDIQADIFDHIYAILPEFGLRAFQSPSGADLRSLKGIS